MAAFINALFAMFTLNLSAQIKALKKQEIKLVNQLPPSFWDGDAIDFFIPAYRFYTDEQRIAAENVFISGLEQKNLLQATMGGEIFRKWKLADPEGGHTTVRKIQKVIETQRKIAAIMEIKRWLSKFFAELRKNKSPTDLAHRFVQIGVNEAATPLFERDTCNTDNWFSNPENQLLFNSIVYAMIMYSNKLYALRNPLRRDTVETEDCFFEESKIPYGKIVSKEYGQALLDHFLNAAPSPDWVDMCLVKEIINYVAAKKAAA